MLTISRTKRVIGAFFNLITLGGLLIGNLILLFSKGTTIGGLVAGYKYENKGLSLILLYLIQILVGLGYELTLGILWIYDIVTMGKRDGTIAESIVSNRKIHR